MQLLKDIAIAISLANLCFLRVWAVLFDSDSHYFMKAPPFINLAAAILNVLLLAAAFWVLLNLARRLTRAHAKFLAQWAFLVVLIVPLNGIRQELPPMAGLLVMFGRTGSVIFGLLLGIIAVFVLWRWYRSILRAAATIVLILSPFVLITFSQAAWLLMKYGVTYAHKAPATHPTNRKISTPRVLWFIFDGMDQRITFLERDFTVKLPEINRLRSQALYANNAYPPTAVTLLSMPSLITGKQVTEAHPVNPSELMITFRGANEAVGWSTQPNIFSKARGLGFNTAVVGWYHPYCRVIGSHLTTCSWQEESGSVAGNHQMLSETMLNQVYSLWPWRPRQYHIEAYLQILKDGKKAVIDSSLGLVLVHFPVPHRPYIYDRINGEFTLLNYSIAGYLDNLVLADRTLGELRSVMEAKGMWENTVILLTSDHWWYNSSQFDGKVDHRVPFVLKLAGQKKGVVYEPAFNTILTHDLFLALLSGEVSGVDSVVSWLDQHRSKVEGPEDRNNL